MGDEPDEVAICSAGAASGATGPAGGSGSKLIVAAALIDSLAAPTRLLAARRTYPPALAGRWELPGGKVEPGEDPAAALERELAEELGVGVRVGAQVDGPVAGDWPLPGVGVAKVWLAEIVSGAPAILTEGHDRLVWLGREELHEVDWLDGDLAIVAALGKLIGGAP